MSGAFRRRVAAVATWIATFLLMLVICLPGLWVMLTGFRPNREVLSKPAIWIPEQFNLDNFAKIFGFGAEQVAIPVPSYFANSLIIRGAEAWAGTLALETGVGGRVRPRLRVVRVPLP